MGFFGFRIRFFIFFDENLGVLRIRVFKITVRIVFMWIFGYVC